MDREFWLSRWSNDEIGFHLDAPNPRLIAYFDLLRLKAGSRVFVPLCGKTQDIAWLLTQGMHVVGVELSELAIGQLFDELQITPTIAQQGLLRSYTAPHLMLWVGDIFDLTAGILGKLGQIDAVYDRAALVALPPAMRDRYTKHILAITQEAPQLLLTFQHGEDKNMPPFSVDESMVRTAYEASYGKTGIKKLASYYGQDCFLKGRKGAAEHVFLCKKEDLASTSKSQNYPQLGFESSVSMADVGEHVDQNARNSDDS